MLVYGDKKWITTLHYAFQDDDYLVSVLHSYDCYLGVKSTHPFGIYFFDLSLPSLPTCSKIIIIA